MATRREPDPAGAVGSDEAARRTSHEPPVVIATADARYVPISSFAEWTAVPVEQEQWESYIALLPPKESLDAEVLKRAITVVARAAAFETGKIENLYQAERGITLTIAMQTAMWEAEIAKRGAQTRALFESQLASYEMVMDFATKAVPVAEAWIRELHSVATASQETYEVVTTVGVQQQALPRGQYKISPNHVVKEDGSLHAYAPVGSVAEEVRRLCDELRSPEFVSAHPVLQAAYAHHALVAIHPFADGNGRVARALASVFTYRSHSAPLLILGSHKDAYFAALAEADAGNLAPFVRFVQRRAQDAMTMTAESLRTATGPEIESGLSAIGRLYVTKGGFHVTDVDAAAGALLAAIEEEARVVVEMVSESAQIATAVTSGGELRVSLADPSYRYPLKYNRSVMLTLQTPAPTPVTKSWAYAIQLPRGGSDQDEILVVSSNDQIWLHINLRDLLGETSEISDVIRYRLRMHLMDGLSKALGEIAEEVQRKVAG